MLISDERIHFLAQEIAQTLVREGMLTTTEPNAAAQGVKQALIKYCQAEGALEQKVRTKIASLKRAVAEGSQEWDILYQQYYKEELNKSA